MASCVGDIVSISAAAIFCDVTTADEASSPTDTLLESTTKELHGGIESVAWKEGVGVGVVLDEDERSFNAPPSRPNQLPTLTLLSVMVTAGPLPTEAGPDVNIEGSLSVLGCDVRGWEGGVGCCTLPMLGVGDRFGASSTCGTTGTGVCTGGGDTI